MEETRNTRRDLLKVTALGAAAIAGANLFREAEASGSAPVGEHQWAMVIDQSKCTGCGYCTLACQAHNDTAPDHEWNKVLDAGKLGDHQIFLARPCMQCAKAPCVEVCPVAASYYRPDGIVMMDYDRCIGCRYCEVACPYQARVFNWEKFEGPNPAVPKWGQPEVERRPRGVPEKCAFCYHRIDRGLSHGLAPGVDDAATPACVVACPTGARMFGDLNDHESNVSQILREHPSYRLRDDLGTGARVYYLPADPKEMDVEA
ncbi:MAG: sulfate reduction electron transfer complex DsrMKJOP subunit DsrO [Chloroflexota bacterium]